jgi:lysozyme
LREDVRIAEQAVLILTHAPLTFGQFDSLTSFIFNLGTGAFQRSTLRSRINRNDPDAHEEFHKWIYAGGKKLKGLILRRSAEAQLYQS